MDTPTPLVPAPVVPPAQVLLPAHHVRWKLISAIFVIALFAGAYIVFAKTKSACMKELREVLEEWASLML